MPRQAECKRYAFTGSRDMPAARTPQVGDAPVPITLTDSLLSSTRTFKSLSGRQTVP
jgi:hypothetical protein